MIIQKWNEKTKEYIEHFVPYNWNIKLLSDDMSETINCVNCGKEMEFGEGLTSLRYHTVFGMGYYECQDCYFKYLPIYVESKKH